MQSPYPLDETRASEFVGKTVLIGVTYLDSDGNMKARMQWSGTIRTYSNPEGIRVDLDDSEEPCCLPPDSRILQKAKPGVYRLKATDREVENPDYVTTWTCREPKPQND